MSQLTLSRFMCGCTTLPRQPDLHFSRLTSTVGPVYLRPVTTDTHCVSFHSLTILQKNVYINKQMKSPNIFFEPFKNDFFLSNVTFLKAQHPTRKIFFASVKCSRSVRKKVKYQKSYDTQTNTPSYKNTFTLHLFSLIRAKYSSCLLVENNNLLAIR